MRARRALVNVKVILTPRCKFHWWFTIYTGPCENDFNVHASLVGHLMGPARSTACEHGIQAAAVHAQATKAHRQPKATMKGAASAKSSDLLLRCFDSPRIPGCRCARVHALRACVAARWHRVRNCGGPVAISIICATPGGSRAGCGAPIRAGMVAPDSEYAEPMT